MSLTPEPGWVWSSWTWRALRPPYTAQSDATILFGPTFWCTAAMRSAVVLCWLGIRKHAAVSHFHRMYPMAFYLWLWVCWVRNGVFGSKTHVSANSTTVPTPPIVGFWLQFAVALAHKKGNIICYVISGVAMAAAWKSWEAHLQHCDQLIFSSTCSARDTMEEIYLAIYGCYQRAVPSVAFWYVPGIS